MAELAMLFQNIWPGPPVSSHYDVSPWTSTVLSYHTLSETHSKENMVHHNPVHIFIDTHIDNLHKIFTKQHLSFLRCRIFRYFLSYCISF